MATFQNKELSSYLSFVVDDILKGKKIQLGKTGHDGEVIFDITAIKKLVNKNLIGEGLKLAVTLNAKSVPNMARRSNDSKSQSYFITNDNFPYKWTEIFKGVYSGRVGSISTPQQEQITLRIMEEVLNSNTKKWKSFSEMYLDKKTGLKKIFPDLAPGTDWHEHFSLQFREVYNTTGLKNSSFDTYLYEGESSFMKFITEIVKKVPHKYSKKDSWNPADIWLVNSKVSKGRVMIDNQTFLGGYREAIEEAQTTKELNHILKQAFYKRHICGISLKKSNRKTLHYDLINLELKESDQKLPDIEYDYIDMDCSYNEEDGRFESLTSYVYVKDKSQNEPSFKLAFKSNTGEKIGNITYEFLAASKASAFLGKVPKDQLKMWIAGMIKDMGDGPAKQMPQSVNLSNVWTDSVKNNWIVRVDAIKDVFGQNEFTGLDKFIDNLEDSYSKGGLSVKNTTMQQMVEFVYILAKLKKNLNTKDESTDRLNEFCTLSYYFAQKKGQKWGFGPFGKLY
jgi:hypothetical protein